MYIHNNKTYLTWADYDKSVSQMVSYINDIKSKGKSVHLVGLVRGSFSLVQSLSNQLSLPYTLLKYSTYDDNDVEVTHLFSSSHPNTNTIMILVDDIADTGQSIIKTLDFYKGYNITPYTIVGRHTHPKDWLYTFEYAGWTVFPWEQSNTVMCFDCTHSEVCNKDDTRRHCNLFDKSFESDHYCKQGAL